MNSRPPFFLASNIDPIHKRSICIKKGWATKINLLKPGIESYLIELPICGARDTRSDPIII